MAKVLMYILSTFPVYWKINKSCRARGIPFYFVDYDLASQSEQNKIPIEVMKGTGHIGFPFASIDDVVVIRFNLEMSEQFLKSEKFEPTNIQA
jgi:hypothetical protein